MMKLKADLKIELGEDTRNLEQLLCVLDDDQRELLLSVMDAIAEGSRGMNPARIHEVVRAVYLTENMALNNWYLGTIKSSALSKLDLDDFFDEEDEEEDTKEEKAVKPDKDLN